MTEYRYSLERYKTPKDRYHCPACGKKEFTRYIDNETKEHLNSEVGICNRSVNCGYHYKPKQYFADNNITSFEKKEHSRLTRLFKPKAEPLPISYIPAETVEASMNPKAYGANCFIQYLTSLFGVEQAEELSKRYRIGTSKRWQGSTVFWQIDAEGKARTGKVMLYNPDTGKRVKEPYSRIDWVHNICKIPNFNLEQCYFGLHLVNESPEKPVALVESEKTAVIASVYLPMYVWVAVGSLNNLTRPKIEPMRNRDVVLFPDLNCFERWRLKAVELSDVANFQLFDALEQKADESERKNGLDIADYLMRFDPKEF